MRALRAWGILISASLVALAGCDGDSPSDDGGMPGVDGGGPGTDGGGPNTDGGDPGTDGGGPGADGGPTDGGPGTDGGGPASDAGPATCGDRRITAPEECDDGNIADGDGCDASCAIEPSATCGDGVVDRADAEECDDGGTADGDGCSATCRIEAPSGCGDGYADFAAGEECDDGNTRPGDGCSPTCQFELVGAFCGDDSIDPGEICDDGNTANGDGCNPTCNLTGTTSLFVGQPGVSVRGDGVGGAATLGGAGTLAVDASYLWFGEGGGGGGAAGSLRRIEIATATVTTVGTLPGAEALGMATDGAGMIWIATDGAGTPGIWSFDTSGAPPYTAVMVSSSAACAGAGCYADGAPGTATFGGVRGLTWFAGLLWFVDPPAGTIRTLDPSTGDIATVAGSPFMNSILDGVGAAARFESPRYIVSDNSGTLYISETNGNTIRALNATTNEVTTFAGMANVAGHVDGVGAAARLDRPRGITADGTSVYFVEFGRNTVRQGILATGAVSTLAGPAAGSGGGYAEGVGTAARFDAPWSIAYHFPSNSLFVVDGGNDVIRRIR